MYVIPINRLFVLETKRIFFLSYRETRGGWETSSELDGKFSIEDLERELDKARLEKIETENQDKSFRQ